VKDRAALGVIEAAEVDGRYVCSFLFPPALPLHHHTYSARVLRSLDLINMKRKKKKVTDFGHTILFLSFGLFNMDLRFTGSSQAARSSKGPRATRASAWRTSAAPKGTAA